MGCFSVSCGITSAAIYSQEAVMLLLVEEPRVKDYGDKYGHQWGYIPVVIRGRCTTYGGLENIQETPGTKILEKYFGIPIAHLCEIATCNREKTCYISETFALGIPEVKKAMADYHTKFDEAYLELLGFKLDGDKLWVHPDFPVVKVHLWESETRRAGDSVHFCRPYEINETVSQLSQKNKEAFVNDFEELTGRSLLFAKEDQLKIKRLELLDHVLFDAQAWDAFASNDFDESGEISRSYIDDTWCHSGYKEHLLKLGFVMDPEPNGHSRYSRSWRHPSSDKFFVMSDGTWAHISATGTLSDNGLASTYSVKKLMLAWYELTGEELTLPQEEYIKTSFDFYFERLAADILKIEEGEHPAFKEYKLRDSMRMVSPCYEHAEWNYFLEIFRDSIIDGSIQPEAGACSRVRSNMHSVGKLIQPDTGGYQPQCGDYQALKRLGQVTLAIAERELAVREQYGDDEDDES